MRKVLIAGNWKANNTIPDALKLLAAIQHHLKVVPEDVDVVIIPPFTALFSMDISLQEFPLALGGQDLFWEDNGAYTGEVTGAFLKDAGCNYVIVGHSERRKFFGDTNETVNKKMFAALRNDLIPIMCVGETLEERETNKHMAVVELQIKEGLKNIHLRDAENIVIAYEPVWAIGTGKTATATQAQEMHGFIRNLVEKIFDAPTANNMRILYGGSVNPSNCAELLVQKDIDGALVGGASLNGEQFAAIIKAAPHKTL